MNRLLTAFVLAVSLIANVYARPCWGRVDIDVNIGVPPPPAIVFPSPPEVVVIPRTRVYYVPAATEYDMYQYGPYWYVNRDGYWYRSSTYGGPFTVVDYRYVPHQIVVVPREYRHHPLHPHGGPPGHWKHSEHGRGHGHHKDRD